MSDDTGPPVNTEGQTGTPATTTGDDVVIEGESPHEPPADADNIVEPGGSPSDDAIAAVDPSITSLTPDTAAVGADATVTVAGTNFRDDSVVEAEQSAVPTVYVSDTELTATLSDPGGEGAETLTVRNPSSEQESNGVDFTWTAASAGRKKK